MHFDSLKRILSRKIRKEDIYRTIDRIANNPLLKKKIFLISAIAILVSIFFIESSSHFYTRHTDFSSFYTAAKGILQDIRIYDQKEFQKLADSLFGSSRIVYPYLYWPVLAQIMSPLAFLDYSLYSQLFLIVNILLTLLCLYLIAILLDLRTSKSNLPLLFLFLTIIVNKPLEKTFYYGQINILVFAIILVSLLLLKHKKEYASSFFMCLAVYLKIYPLLFLVLFFFQKRYRYILYAAINFMLIFLFSILVFSPHTWVEFFQMAANNFLYGKKPEFFFDYNAHWGNCSLNGFLSQLSLIINIPRKFVMPALVGLIVACFFLFKSKLKKILTFKDTSLQISFVFILSLILSTISWNHHYVTMIFPLAYLLNRIILEKRYNYLIPYFLVVSPIIYQPDTAGFPFNQILLMATLLFLVLLLYFHFRRRPEFFLKLKG